MPTTTIQNYIDDKQYTGEILEKEREIIIKVCPEGEKCRYEREKEDENYEIINYRFDRYDVKIKLTLDKKFIEITEIKTNKEFLSHEQRIMTSGYIDVSDLYRE